MKFISSRDNPLFKKLKGLAQDSREIRKQARTLLDGPHLVATYLQRIGLPEALVVSELGVKSAEVRQLLASHQPLEPFCLKDSLFKEVSPSDSPVGILSLIEVPNHKFEIPTDDCLLLDALQDAGNVGTLLRSAAAFGIKHVYLGAGCANAWQPKVLRAAQGAHFSVRIYEKCDLAAVLQQFSGISLATVVQDGVSLYSLRFDKPIAWVIGNEGQGLSPDLVELCERRVTIPMSNETESLNAAVAASICMAEMARQRVVS